MKIDFKIMCQKQFQIFKAQASKSGCLLVTNWRPQRTSAIRASCSIKTWRLSNAVTFRTLSVNSMTKLPWLMSEKYDNKFLEAFWWKQAHSSIYLKMKA